MKRVLVLAVCLLVVPSVVSAQDGTPAPSKPLGQADVGQWVVALLAVYDDPLEIDPKDEFFTYWIGQNPIPEGKTWLTVRLSIANIGERAGYPMMDLMFSFVSDTGYVYDPRTDCGDVPGRIQTSTQVDAGGRVEGTLCRAIDTDRLGKVQLSVKQLGGTEVLFSLNGPPGTPVTAA